MTNHDTIYLLQECNTGTQMAVYSIDEVLEKITNPKLKTLLSDSKKVHEQIGSKLHQLLQKYGDETKEPGILAKGMSWMKTNVKLAMEDSDRVCADLITEGCNMGVKTLQKYLNEYTAADNESKKLTKDLIQEEEKLTEQLKEYL